MASHTLEQKGGHRHSEPQQEVGEGREQRARAPTVILNKDTISIKGRMPHPSSGPSWRRFVSISGQEAGGNPAGVSLSEGKGAPGSMEG